MKKIFIILSALFTVSSANAQSCLPEGITFETQAQIDGFQENYPNCTVIEGSVVIYGDDITDLNGLSVLKSVGGLEIYNSINNLSGLEGLISVAGDVRINDHSLITLTGLDNLQSIGGNFFIANNDSLTSLNGLESLTAIGGTLYVYNNTNLTSFVGINSLTVIGGDLSIGFNYSLTNFAGLENLTSIGSNLYIMDSYYFLNSLTGLDNLTSIGGNLEINGTNALTSLTGLESLTSIEGYLKIDNNNNLSSLQGLDSLTSIGGYLSITGTNTLTSLTGLESLISIGDSIDISDNYYLSSLAGLDNINAGTVISLNISWNNSLSICDVKSVCDYLENPSGSVCIENNATGCNSRQEVKDACSSGWKENDSPESHINIYPNPSSTTITISMPTMPDKNTYLTIYDINGQELIQRNITGQKTVVDVFALKTGIYILKVVYDDGVMVVKSVKQ